MSHNRNDDQEPSSFGQLHQDQTHHQSSSFEHHEESPYQGFAEKHEPVKVEKPKKEEPVATDVFGFPI